MRRVLTAIAATATTLVPVTTATAAQLQPVPVTAPARAAGPSPSAHELALAVRHARRSRYLWATVNICMARRGPGGVIGIRGEMGALGFPATLSMTIRLREYDAGRRRFVTVPGTTATRSVSLGQITHGIHQGGAEFPYSSDTGRLDGSVTFTWTRGGHRLLRLTRTTSGGHPSAAYGRPHGHSTASCRL